MAAFTTALLALAGLKAGEAAFGIAGANRQARAVRHQGWYEADQLGRNAAFAEEQAADALTRGAQAVSRSRADTAQLHGAQRAALAASGVDVNSGSAAELQGDTVELGELDALLIRNNAAREARGFAFQADEYRRGAALTLRASRAQARGIRAGRWTTLLGAAADVASLAAQWPGGGGGGMKVPYRPKPIGTSYPGMGTGSAGPGYG